MGTGIGRGLYKDPMINYGEALKLEPVRVMVEFGPEEFAIFDRATGRVPPAQALKVMALERVAATGGELENALRVHCDRGDGERWGRARPPAYDA